ncbi:cation diffusion facilitator family transporter [Luteimonas sp. RC10]|uniref:cation diffusion facilitator family transporter n=1 Tax=Luteimonas sp. RC10 TaxID=2587035 RepID=UPI00161B6969|nr:cation diffusion facilitator family transporter [Luteimonas sp. RC10]MBB3344675.1 cobalt-zinc-cadmium efflux system protein [Luteimonas sp. RC10]
MSHAHDHTAHKAHAHAHDHDHAHAPSVSAANERAVLTGFALTASFMVVEMVGGVLSGSLALIADAGHMLTDAAALLLAWLGFRIGRRASDARRTFGYMRIEVLAGLINAITLFALVVWIAWEAVQRLRHPGEVLAGPMLAVAVVGLLVNCLVFWILHRGDQSHVNIKGATLHVLGDLLGSVAAIVAALVIHFTGWMPIDPILSVLVCLLILRSAWALLRGAFDILMEATPPDIDIEALRAHLREQVPGVAGVDHVHVWSITSGRVLATLELALDEDAAASRVVPAVKRALADRFSIGHTTVEVVHAPHDACALESGHRASHGHAHTHDHDHDHDHDDADATDRIPDAAKPGGPH